MRHEWIDRVIQSRPLALTVCKNCGIVKQRDGSSDARECKGVVMVALREEA